MFNIDFGSLPEGSKKKLAPEEITVLNGLFQDPIIQTQLEDIEWQRKIRQKWKYIIYGGCALLAMGLSLLFDQGNILAAESFYMLVIWPTLISYVIGMWVLHKRFASKIEIPLKTEVLTRICPLLYSKLQYSHDEKYSFDELDLLRQKGFLESYKNLDRVEDSVYFDMENDGKHFSVNGFEIETSEERGSGKNRKRVTTNHCYLMKAVFPNARIPLTSDLMITTDQIDVPMAQKLGAPIFFSSIIGSIVGFGLSESLIVGIIVGVTLGVIAGGCAYFFQNLSQSNNRVQLENIEFEKLFDVKCADQVTSRMIITPAFMDRIVSFVKKTGNQYEFLIQGNTMYIKRQIQGGYLEVGTEKNMLTNIIGFAQFYIDMREIIQFTYDMNLMYLSKTDTLQLTGASALIPQVTPIALAKIDPLGSSLARFHANLSMKR